MFLILNPVFEKQHGIMLAIQPYKKDAETVDQVFQDIKERDFNDRERLRRQTHNIYRSILATFGCVWILVLVCTAVDRANE
jgi:hypothetical protein